MKQLFCLLLVLFLFGCEDTFEDTHRYSKLITQSKEYPVYLDMSETGKIQVEANSPLAAPFKILSNDRFYFVGDMLKGIHVYEKKAAGASYLCFIECRYIKDFELADNRLFYNNLVDMIVIDVRNSPCPEAVSLTMTDELYTMAVELDNSEIWLKGHSPKNGIQPVGWTRRYVKGKVICYSLAHERPNLTGNLTQSILKNIVASAKR